MNSAGLKEETWDEVDALLPIIRDFCPLYSTVKPSVMAACIRAMRGEGPPHALLADKSPEWIALVGQTALEAEAICDGFLRLEPSAQLAFPLEGLSDFTLIALNGILLERTDAEHMEALNVKMDEMMLAVLDSETASPMLDYDWIFQDAVQYQVTDRHGVEPVWTLKRAAAHNRTYGGGEQLTQILSHMACVCMELEDNNEAVRIYEALLRFDPLSFDTIHSLACDLAHVGCFRAAIQVARHLSAMSSMDRQRRLSCPGIAADIELWEMMADGEADEKLSCKIYSALHDTLYTSNPGHFDKERLIREAVSDIDDVPIKRSLL